jgi:enoyl-CoA hydratase/carnithine racemase
LKGTQVGYETILLEVEAGIATITLNRPDRLNAWNRQMAMEIIDAIDRTDADDAIRAVIFTGSGRAFCAGMDLAGGGATFDFASRSGGDSPVQADGTIDYAHERVRDTVGLVTLRLYRSLKPVICAVNGPAVGAGVTIQLAMDIRIAADTARFGFVFTRRGIVPEGASAWFLPRLVGPAQALEWMLSGRLFSAEEARAGGLVRSLHAPENLLAAARELAGEIAQNAAPVSVALTRRMIWSGLAMQHPMEMHRIDSRSMFSRGRSADAGEGVTSFLEKRPPAFTGSVACAMPEFYPWQEEPPYR